MSLPKLWVVSPVYLDVESFLVLRREILEILAPQTGSCFSQIELVAVDDTGGLDPEMERLREVSQVTVVEPPFNLGHQRALVYALRSLTDRIAETDFVVTLDADGEDRPADLPRLLEPLLADPSNTRTVALALRTKRQESVSFKILYFLFRILFRSLTGIVVRSGNYVAFRGWMAHRLLFHPHFDLCYSSTFISLNLKIDYVPAERGMRYAGRSRMSYSKLLMHGVRMLLPFTDRIAIRALVAFSLAFGISSLLLLGGIAVRVLTETPVPDWAISVPLVIMALCFVAVGNLILLFAAFTQSRSTSLKNLERERHERPRITSAAAN